MPMMHCKYRRNISAVFGRNCRKLKSLFSKFKNKIYGGCDFELEQLTEAVFQNPQYLEAKLKILKESSGTDPNTIYQRIQSSGNANCTVLL